MKLVTPSSELESEFALFYDDFLEHDIENSEHYMSGISEFPSYIQRLSDDVNGINLREGYVPCSHFWLVNREQKILGAIRIRHNLDSDFLLLEAGHIGYDIAPSSRNQGYGKIMLKLALEKVKELNISNALITADEDNIASRKVIEANGGEFDNIVVGKVFPWPIARYWVNCE